MADRRGYTSLYQNIPVQPLAGYSDPSAFIRVREAVRGLEDQVNLIRGTIGNSVPGYVSSVGLTAPAIFSVTGSPVTDTGTIVLSLVSQTARSVFAAPTGGAGTPTFRALEALDIQSGTFGIARGGTGLSSTPTNGQLLIGNGTGYTLANLTAGSGISITDGAGSITVTNTLPGFLNPMTTLGDIIYGGSAGAATRLGGETTTTRKFLRSVGVAGAATAPSWDTVTKTDVGLGNVEDVALSTWAGSTNLTTLGTISTGIWNGTAIGYQYGGTGLTSAANNALLIGNGTGWSTFGPTTSPAGVYYFAFDTVNGYKWVNTIGPEDGGTGITSYTVGDLLYASGATALSKLAVVDKGILYGTTTGPAYTAAANLAWDNTAKQLTVGGPVVVGTGDGTITATGNTLRGPSGAGSNIAGGSLTIAGGQGTGLGLGGSLLFQTAAAGTTGSAQNPLTTRLTIDSTGLAAFTGAVTASTFNKVTITSPASSATLTIANGKTLTVSNTVTFSGTDASTVAFGAGGTIAYLGTANAFTGANTFTNTTGQIFRQATNQDGILLRGRNAGTGGWTVELVPGTLTANRTVTLADGNTTLVAGTMVANPMTTLGDLIYGGSSGAPTRLAGDITNARTFLRSLSVSGVASAPVWDTVTKTDVGLGNVENTALSTWNGSSNITTVGTIGTGTWSGNTIAANKGGTGVANTSTITVGGAITTANSFTTVGNFSLTLTTTAATNVTLPTSGTLIANPMTTSGDLIYGAASGAPTRLAGEATTTRKFLMSVGVAGVAQIPAWAQVATSDLTGTLGVGNGGTGATTLTANGVLYGSGASAIAATAVGATGTVLIGTTGAAPSWSDSPSAKALTLTTVNLGYTTSGLQLRSSVSGASASSDYFFQRGADSTVKDLIVVHTPNSAGMGFAHMTSGGVTRFYSDGSTGDFGIGTNAPGARLDIADTGTSTAAAEIMVRGIFTRNPGAVSSALADALSSQLILQGGANNLTARQSAGTFSVSHTGTGTVTRVDGVTVLAFSKSTAGTITELSAFRADSPSVSTGTVSTAYGLYVDTQDTGASVTKGYGVYQAGTSDVNYYAGRVFLNTTDGTTDASARLLVREDVDGFVGTVVRNNDAVGTSASAFLSVATGTSSMSMYAFGAGYTTSGMYEANGAAISSSKSAGLTIGAINAAGLLKFYTGGSTSTNERLRITAAGDVGIGTTSPSYLLSFGGNSARTVSMERHTTANTAGNSLTLQSGGATSGATDKNAGDLILAPGVATGTGRTNIRLQSRTRATASGTGDNALIDRLWVTSQTPLPDNTLTNLVTLTLSNGAATGGTIFYTIIVADGTNAQSYSGHVHYTAVKTSAGVLTTNIKNTTENAFAQTTVSTLGVTWAMAASGSNVVVQVTADSGYAAFSTGYPQILYTIVHNGREGIVSVP